jgi:uncharacterized protein (DUF983 family)
MNCPRCARRFSFFDSLKVVNPWKHRCPDCAAVLTAGRQGFAAYMVALTLGFTVAGVAIAMEETGTWTERGSVVWFAIAMPIVVVLYLLGCWKWVRFKERESAV